MRTAEPRLGVVFEHPVWFTPLFAELDRREIPYDSIDVSAHGFDPGVRALPWSMALNRMSPSAYLRGHGQAITYTREYLRYLEAAGVDVVNGAAAFELETSKVSQLLRLAALGLPTPRSRVINDTSLLPAAAEGLRYPVIVKPNIGGSGAGMQRFETPEALRAAAADRTLTLGVDHTALVQEFLPARGGHIVRVEFLDGRFLYAIKIYPTLAAGFNLCPADICHPDGRVVAAGADLCPVDLPKVALRVEGCTPPAEVIGDVLAIARASGLDLGGVEYLVDDRDGRVYYYDINALSNFVTDAVRLVGFDPYAVLADYLVARGRLREPARLRS
ncbi:MAG TPA: hypothetical protein VKV57_06320 [bacterium]|nr:hypothetical protein [bacterium]